MIPFSFYGYGFLKIMKGCHPRVTSFPSLPSRMSESSAPFKKLKFSFPNRRDSSVLKHRALGDASSAHMNNKHTSGPMYRVPGYLVWDHTFRVPLNWKSNDKNSPEITVFAREVVSPSKSHAQLPYLLYLQGGPGFAAILPIDGGSWLKTATTYYRVILLDQRGTGRSSPVTCWNLQKVGSPEEQAAYLMHFRSDSIVCDAEFVRKSLIARSSHGMRWSILGQSYGGFCCVHYLSAAPEALNEVLITGGIPPDIGAMNTADEVYERTYRRVITQNEKFYRRYPGDIEVVRQIVRHLLSQPEGYVLLPSGSKLRPRGLQLLGCAGLGFAGGFDRLHYLLEAAFDGDQLSYRFLKLFESWMSWETNPLYLVLHESIYTQGPATQWAAHRVRNQHYHHLFDASASILEDRPVYFVGEMMYPWMFEDFKELIPLKPTAEIIASINNWPQLYDLDVLSRNTVSTASATYYEDMYVDFELAQRSIPSIKGCRQWVTNEYMHSGLRDDGNRILEKLIGMTRDSLLLQ